MSQIMRFAMKSLFALLLSTLFAHSLPAQPALQWQKSIGGTNFDEVTSIQQTDDGGYIAAGFTSSNNGDIIGNHGGIDFLVVKYNHSGTIEWQKTYGGSGVDWGYAIENTPDGGFIMAGYTDSNNGDVTGNHGDYDYWVVKLSPSGSLEWQKCFGGSALDRANDVVQAEDGGYIVMGQASSSNGDITNPRGGYDIWVVKMSHNGTLEWQKSFGGSDQDWGQAIQRTIDGGYVICGSNWSNDGDIEDPASIYDIWVLKLSREGTLEWQKLLGGSIGETGRAIQQTSDGGYIVGGMAWSSDGALTENKGKSDFWVVKLSAASVGVAPEPHPLPMEISPNPATESITLRFGGDGATNQVSIMDAQGRRRLRARASDGGQIDVSRLPAGLYFVSAWSATGSLYSGKFLKGF